MIKHIVMWKFKETAHGQDLATNARQTRDRLESLRGQIPGLLHIEVGLDFSATPNSAHVVLYSEFESREALAVYQAHPLHQAIVPFVVEAATERRLVDYEL
ncbi:MAG: Dabb family protein [Rhodoferax sp.]|jgi:quinol monooxygenase YgiN|nr:Dabb family protein [Rhodoferax sp.]